MINRLKLKFFNYTKFTFKQILLNYLAIFLGYNLLFLQILVLANYCLTKFVNQSVFMSKYYFLIILKDLNYIKLMFYFILYLPIKIVLFSLHHVFSNKMKLRL